MVREAMLRRSHFSEFRERLGVAPDILSARLSELVAIGILEAVDYQRPGDRTRSRHVLTDMARDLAPVLAAMGVWPRPPDPPPQQRLPFHRHHHRRARRSRLPPPGWQQRSADRHQPGGTTPRLTGAPERSTARHRRVARWSSRPATPPRLPAALAQAHT